MTPTHSVNWNMAPGGAFDQMQALITAYPELLSEFQRAMADMYLFMEHTPHTLGVEEGVSGVRKYAIDPVIVHFRIANDAFRVEVIEVYLWEE
jgi:hypothetical protein